MNKFYTTHPVVQWSVAVPMLLVLLILVSTWVTLVLDSIAWALLLPLVVSFSQFLLAPFAKLIGWYLYLSPMLIAYMPNDQKYDLHNGTPFDYLIVMRGVKPGVQFANRMVGHYIDGLLDIVRRIETGKLPASVEVRGSSYFLGERRAERLGFTLSRTGLFEVVNILSNYMDLVWMYSLSRGQLTFPNLLNVKTASISGSQLVAQKPLLLRLKKRLNA